MHLFWRRHPALLQGLAALLGTSFALSPSLALFLPTACLFLPLGKKCLFPLLTLFTSFLLSHHSTTVPLLPEKGLKGEARIHIESIQTKEASFRKSWLYKGTIETFTVEGEVIGKRIPFQISLPRKKENARPRADCDYTLTGTLQSKGYGRHFLQLEKNTPWNPIAGTFSLAEKRFLAKDAVTKFIHNKIPKKKAAIFLAGITTGDFDDKVMQKEFGRFGLQHIMAISGFHFSLLAALFRTLLRLLLPTRAATAILSVLLLIYFLFLGPSASILRAFFMILIALLGFIFERTPSGLNSLGFALLLTLLYDPHMAKSLAFQFSFAIAGSILLLTRPFDTLLTPLFPRYPFSILKTLPQLDQYCYLFLSTLRSCLALSLAVNVAALPITLLYFGQFPYLGLLFNLFFPFLVSLSVFLLLLSLLFPPLHTLNTSLTNAIVELPYQVPATADTYLACTQLTSDKVISLLTLFFIAGALLSKRLESNSKIHLLV